MIIYTYITKNIEILRPKTNTPTLRISMNHAQITNDGQGSIWLYPDQGEILYNGKPLADRVLLNHQDRLPLPCCLLKKDCSMNGIGYRVLQLYLLVYAFIFACM